MGSKLIKNLLLILVTICLIIPQVLLSETVNQVLAEEPPPEPPSEFSYPGRIVAIGTFFFIQDSESANITLTSTEEVKVVVDSIPGMISLTIGAAGEGIDNTVLTLEGLDPNKTYYKYEDDFVGGSTLVSDENGSHIWTQDLTQLHLVWIQEEEGTISIPEQASTYGTWDDTTRTFTLEQDLTETVWITESNITLDGNGHTIGGTGSGYGIFSHDTTDIIVKNFNIEEFAYGIEIIDAGNVTVSNCTVSNIYGGIGFGWSSGNITINSNNVLNSGFGIETFFDSSNITINSNNVLNGLSGIDIIFDSSNITVNDNIVSNQSYEGIRLSFGCHNSNFRNNTVSNCGYGVSVWASDDGNRILHNNFIDNVEKPQARVWRSSGSYLFDDGYPSGGNYWSDYTGVDQYRGPNQDQPGSDGIGDTPYTFYGGEDRYPFMSPLAVLSADFSWSPDKPVIGDNVTFDASNSTGNIISYEWDFGDNTTATTGNITITHTYQNVGVFPASLTVTSSDNETASVVKEVTIRPWSFAVITDLHIGRGYDDYGSPSSGYEDYGISGNETSLDYYLTERLTAAVDWINTNRDNLDYRIDFVVVMGDVADSAEKAELLKAKNVLDGLNDPNDDGDTADGIPYVPIFGNHDIRPETEEISSNFTSPIIGQYFEQVFWTENATTNKNLELIKSVTDDFIRQEDDNPGPPYFQNYYFRYKGISFISLDFVERIPPTFSTSGVAAGANISDSTSYWLENFINESNGEESVIFLCHHVFRNNFTDSFNYLEYYWLETNLGIYERKVDGTQLLGSFSGHIHGAEETLPAGIDWWYNANREYDPIAGAPVVTTEAIMVGSNLQDDVPGNDNDLRDVNKGIIRIIKVLGKGEIDYKTIEGRYNPDTGEGKKFIALNPRLNYDNGETVAPDDVLADFVAKAFTERDIREFNLVFDDTTVKYVIYPSTKYSFHLSPGIHKVKLTTIDDATEVEETITYYIDVRTDIVQVTIDVSAEVQPISVAWGEDLAINGKSSKQLVRYDVVGSPAKPVALATVHFEQATDNINMTALAADYDTAGQKSVFYMPVWPAEVEELKVLFIPYSENGTVYICPNATSLDEVSPHSPGTIFLEPEEIVNGMMAVPTIYDGELYHLIYGFTGGGGGVNLPPVADANGPYSGEEGSPVALTASNSTDPNSDPLKYRWDFNSDGTWDTDWLTSANITYTWYDDYTGAVRVEVWDGELADNATAVSNVINVAPTIVGVTTTLAPVTVGTEISTTANFTDPGTADTHVAIWDWGDNSTSAGYVDETVCFVSGNHTYTAVGVYTVKLTVTDDDSASDDSIFHYVVVYNPSAGFATGGGWINSPTGTYPADSSLTGKANFGFVVKYQQGANTPTGQTEFLFKLAGLNFHSTNYEWLVITGAKAILKGEGTINGEGSYKFRVTVIDAEIDPNDAFEEDRFRIKIWEEIDGNEVVIYDNALGDDSDYALTELGGGSIVIHES